MIRVRIASTQPPIQWFVEQAHTSELERLEAFGGRLEGAEVDRTVHPAVHDLLGTRLPPPSAQALEAMRTALARHDALI